MLIDVIFDNKDDVRGGDGGNWHERNSKPPLSNWAVRQIYKATKDLTFIKEMLLKLKVYPQWWYRDHNKKGLVEYRATKHRYHNDENAITARLGNQAWIMPHVLVSLVIVSSESMLLKNIKGIL